MTKQEQFLILVQTVLLANGINRSLDEDALARRHEFSALGILGLMGDALYASDRIPSQMSATEAAEEFCGYMLQGLREEGAQCPIWFQRS